MKHEWEYKKLGEVCESDLGKTLNQSKDTGKMQSYLCSINIQWDAIDLSTIKQARFEDSEFDRYSVKSGDLLICEGGDTGRAAIWEGEPMLYQNALHRIRFNDNVNPRFALLYIRHLKNNGDIDSKYSKGVTIKHLVKSSLNSIPLPVPPLPTQQSIVSELDSLSQIIADCKETLKDYDALEQSIFYDMFGDPVKNEKGLVIKRLDEIFSLITDGTHQTPTYTEDKENGVKFLSAKDVTSGDICWDNIKYIPFDLHKELHARLAPQRNDILLCKNGTTGICAIVDTDEVFDIYVSLALLRPNDGCVPLYLKYAINNPWTKQQFDESLKGVGVPNLHLGEIKKVKILLPPLPLQQQFASKIEAIEKMKLETKKALQETETLFQARMDYWFNG